MMPRVLPAPGATDECDCCNNILVIHQDGMCKGCWLDWQKMLESERRRRADEGSDGFYA